MDVKKIEDHETLAAHRRWIDVRTPWPAVAGIWGASTGLAIWAPDMVSGSEQEHLPLAMLTVWLWAAAATAFALLTPHRADVSSWTASVLTVWAATLVAGIFAPVLVTGSDPTRIPLAVVVVPPVAAVVTGLLSLHEASRQLDTARP